MTQIDPLSPTLFNMIMNTVIFHWVTVVVATEEGMEGLGMSIQDLAVYFDAINRIFASIKP